MNSYLIRLIFSHPFDLGFDQNYIWQNNGKMSGKVRQRTSANAADSATQTVNERILKECHKVYTDPDNGEYRFLVL